MSIDTALATELHTRLTEVIDTSIASLPNGLDEKQYRLSCGMIEAWRQVRDVMLPQAVEELQRK